MGTLVVATDGTDPAVAAVTAALDLASTDGDAVVFVSVWKPPAGTFSPRDEFEPELDLVEHDLAQAAVDDALARAASAGIRAEGVVREGDAIEEICALAAEREPRLIVIGSHGYGALVEATLGSVSSSVVHRTTVPVLVVPPRPVQAPPST